MINRKLSLGAVLILSVAQTVAMKRSAGDLVNSESAKVQKHKKTKDPMEKLNKAIVRCNFDKFGKIVGLEPNVVNAKINKKPVVFVLLNEIDKRVAYSQDITQTQWLVGGKNDANMRMKVQAGIEKNRDEAAHLHQCLEMVVHHGNFDAKCTDTCGASVVMNLLARPSTPMHSSAMERIALSESMQPILSALLKKDIPAVNRPDSHGLGFLHYATRMPIYGKEYGEGVDEFVAINELADFYVKSEQNALEAIETIVHAGADINSITTLEGDTALHLAVTDLTKTSLLVALGADTNIKNKDGQIPADISINSRVIEILNDPEKHIEDINKLVLRNSARDTSVKNPCPYTKAVLQKHQDICARDMAREIVAREMSDECADDEISQSEDC